jgi:hypothetical protein
MTSKNAAPRWTSLHPHQAHLKWLSKVIMALNPRNSVSTLPPLDQQTPFYGQETPDYNFNLETPGPPSGVASPAPLLKPSQREQQFEPNAFAEAFARTQHPVPTAGEGLLELSLVRSRRRESNIGLPPDEGALRPSSTLKRSIKQGVPPEMKNLLAEVIFVLVCTAGQIIFALTVGQVMVTQMQFKEALGISATQIPWLIGSSMLASGLSVIISGSLADLAPPKPLMVGAFLWQAVVSYL